MAIEERHITDAQHWLQRQQQESGCFRSVGKLFNNALQVGMGWDGVTWGHVAGGGTDKAVLLSLCRVVYRMSSRCQLMSQLRCWSWGCPQR